MGYLFLEKAYLYTVFEWEPLVSQDFVGSNRLFGSAKYSSNGRNNANSATYFKFFIVKFMVPPIRTPNVHLFYKQLSDEYLQGTKDRVLLYYILK